MVNILVFLFSIEWVVLRVCMWVCVRVCYWIHFVKTKIEIIFQFIFIVSVCVCCVLVWWNKHRNKAFDSASSLNSNKMPGILYYLLFSVSVCECGVLFRRLFMFASLLLKFGCLFASFFCLILSFLPSKCSFIVFRGWMFVCVMYVLTHLILFLVYPLFYSYFFPLKSYGFFFCFIFFWWIWLIYIY